MVRVILTVPDAIVTELQAAAKACHVTANEWASQALHAALAVRRLMRMDATPSPKARLPGEHVALTVKPLEPEPEALDTLADVLPTADDLSTLDDIA